MKTAFASPPNDAAPQISTAAGKSPNTSPPTSHSDHRHSFVAGKFRDALFSAVAAKYATDDRDRSLPFASEQLKSDIERRLHEYLPSFHTPTHLPYASMIQRAIAEVGEEDGLSEESISEFIVNEYEDLPWAHAAFLRRHLGNLCESGELEKSKCGRYNFKVEDKIVKRKKRRRKPVGRRRRGVESTDEIEEDFDGKKQSKKLTIIGPRAEKVVGTEEQIGLLREETVGAKDGDHTQGGQVEVLDELEEVQEDETIDECHEEEIKNKDGLEDFDQQKQSQNLVIIGLRAPVTSKQNEEQSGSLGEEVLGAEGDHVKGGQVQVLGELKGVREDVMIDQRCEKEVESRDGVQDFDEKKQSQNVTAAKLSAQEALTMERTKEKCGLSREEIGAEEGGHAQRSQVIMIYKLKEVGKVGMINDHHKVEVKNRDGTVDFVGRKQLQDLVVVGLHAEETLTTKGTEEQCSSLREKIDGAVVDRAQVGQTEVLNKLNEVQEAEMIDDYHEEEGLGEVMEEPTQRASKGSNGEEGSSEEATLEFFDAMSNHGNAEEHEVIDVQGCKKLQEENENLEFFDEKSDHGNADANEMIDAQSSQWKVLSEESDEQNRRQEQLLSKVSDDQTGTSKGHKVEDCRLSKQQPEVRQSSEITGTPRISIAASGRVEHHTKTLKHAEQGTPSTSEADKNKNTEVLLPSDIICSSKSQLHERRGRGRPRKLNVQGTLAAPFSSCAQDCNQQYLESNVVDKEASGPVTGGDTHHVVDQQQLQRLPRGRGRGRWGRPRVAKQDQISVSETVSPSKHLDHQQSPEKRRRGRPPKRKFDEDILSNDISTSLENEQLERKHHGRGRGRPPRGRKGEKEFF